MNNGTGLVLEGGAMRGVFTAGVIDVMMENGLTFKYCVGVSAGAAFGCNYKSNQPGRVLRYNLKFCRDPKYCSFRSLIRTGNIFGTELCYHDIPERLDPFDVEAFENNPMEFYIVCTDVVTGKAYYKRLDRIGSDGYEWIRASASMPLVSQIVELDGGKYLDGGVTDSIPLRFGEQFCERNIAVLTRPRDYIKKPASNMWLYRRRLKEYPEMVRAIAERHTMYNDQRDFVFAREKEGRVFVICPDEPLDIGRIEYKAEKIQKAYDVGRKTAERQLDEIRRFIANDN